MAQKADLELCSGRDFEKIVIDETVVKINGEQFCPVAAVEPDTIVIPHVGLYPPRKTVLTKKFLRGLKEKHSINDTKFFVDGPPWLHTGLFELGMHFRHETFGERNPVKRIFQEIKN